MAPRFVTATLSIAFGIAFVGAAVTTRQTLSLQT